MHDWHCLRLFLAVPGRAARFWPVSCCLQLVVASCVWLLGSLGLKCLRLFPFGCLHFCLCLSRGFALSMVVTGCIGCWVCLLSFGSLGLGLHPIVSSLSSAVASCVWLLGLWLVSGRFFCCIGCWVCLWSWLVAWVALFWPVCSCLQLASSCLQVVSRCLSVCLVAWVACFWLVAVCVQLSLVVSGCLDRM